MGVRTRRTAASVGVGVAVIDSGVGAESTEFAGRLCPCRRTWRARAMGDEDGHGAAAFTLAGRRDGAGTQGIAFDATLIALRADRPGSCGGGTSASNESSCEFGTDAIARGVDAAPGGGGGG